MAENRLEMEQNNGGVGSEGWGRGDVREKEHGDRGERRGGIMCARVQGKK